MISRHLIQLLSSSKKTGTLLINSNGVIGKIHLRKGKIVFSSVENLPEIAPLRAMCRILSWVTGTFELRGADSIDFPETIDMPTEHILMEGLRRLDEIGNLEGRLPSVETELSVVTPLKAKLTDLGAKQLEVFQIILNHPIESDQHSESNYSCDHRIEKFPPGNISDGSHYQPQ